MNQQRNRAAIEKRDKARREKEMVDQKEDELDKLILDAGDKLKAAEEVLSINDQIAKLEAKKKEVELLVDLKDEDFKLAGATRVPQDKKLFENIPEVQDRTEVMVTKDPAVSTVQQVGQLALSNRHSTMKVLYAARKTDRAVKNLGRITDGQIEELNRCKLKWLGSGLTCYKEDEIKWRDDFLRLGRMLGINRNHRDIYNIMEAYDTMFEWGVKEKIKNYDKNGDPVYSRPRSVLIRVPILITFATPRAPKFFLSKECRELLKDLHERHRLPKAVGFMQVWGQETEFCRQYTAKMQRKMGLALKQKGFYPELSTIASVTVTGDKGMDLKLHLGEEEPLINDKDYIVVPYAELTLDDMTRRFVPVLEGNVATRQPHDTTAAIFANKDGTAAVEGYEFAGDTVTDDEDKAYGVYSDMCMSEDIRELADQDFKLRTEVTHEQYGIPQSGRNHFKMNQKDGTTQNAKGPIIEEVSNEEAAAIEDTDGKKEGQGVKTHTEKAKTVGEGEKRDPLPSQEKVYNNGKRGYTGGRRGYDRGNRGYNRGRGGPGEYGPGGSAGYKRRGSGYYNNRGNSGNRGWGRDGYNNNNRGYDNNYSNEGYNNGYGPRGGGGYGRRNNNRMRGRYNNNW